MVTNRIAQILFSVNPKEVELTTRGFVCSNKQMTTHLETIGKSFLTGYHDAIIDKKVFYESHLSPTYMGFAYEGAAMGFALRDLMGFNNYKRIHQFIKHQPKHIYMIHVGIGWALARVPFVNIVKQTNKFDPLLKGLIIDGYGFHQAYFKTKSYVFDRKFPTELKGHFINAFYQGMGRALWFVFTGQPHKIATHINTFSQEFRSDLWAGVGLAMGYAGGVSETILKQLKSHGDNYLREIGQGVTFACKARLLANNLGKHTQLAAHIFCQMSAENAAHLTDIALGLVDKSAPNSYMQWRQIIIDKLQFETYEKVD